MQDDWRLTNQMKYLYRSTLKKETFYETEKNDHEHCEFCWSTFSDDVGDLHNGYCTLDKHRWICEQCFQDFKEQFEWKVDNSTGDE